MTDEKLDHEPVEHDEETACDEALVVDRAAARHASQPEDRRIPDWMLHDLGIPVTRSKA